MGPVRIYPWRRMHRSRAPSIAPGTFFVAQSWAGCITNMPGFNDRHTRFFRALMADELKRYGRDQSLRVFSFCAAGPFLRGRAFQVLPAARAALVVYRPP